MAEPVSVEPTPPPSTRVVAPSASAASGAAEPPRPNTVDHPDGRPYPWLSGTAARPAGGPRYLLYQPFAGMCNQFSCLECAAAIARITGRTLVLPRWRPQYGWPWLGDTSEYFDPTPLRRLVPYVTLDELEAARRAEGEVGEGAGVALLRITLAYNPTWSEQGFGLYPKLRELLLGLEYFRMRPPGEMAISARARPARW
jgi:hypothetical protein